MNKTFVSRAGQKLDFVITTLNLDINNKVCADFGCSTGGFTDCLLQHNAQKVYSVDTAYGELDWTLRNNPKVIVLERTNALHVKLPELMDLIVIDCGWTKQEKIIPNALNNLQPNGQIITLIKPHYEHSTKHVLTTTEAEEITIKVIENLLQQNPCLTVQNKIHSPILGEKGGNIEIFAVFGVQK